MGKIFVASVVLLMAAPAWAQEICPPYCGGFVPRGSISGPTYGWTTSVQATPEKTKCSPGWTMVDVASRVSGGETIIHKCAAVGDLRDPE
jgi:hypothetical protein